MTSRTDFSGRAPTAPSRWRRPCRGRASPRISRRRADAPRETGRSRSGAGPAVWRGPASGHRHILRPGGELVADMDFASAETATPRSVVVGHVAAETAAEINPVVFLGEQA